MIPKKKNKIMIVKFYKQKKLKIQIFFNFIIKYYINMNIYKYKIKHKKENGGIKKLNQKILFKVKKFFSIIFNNKFYY